LWLKFTGQVVVKCVVAVNARARHWAIGPILVLQAAGRLVVLGKTGGVKPWGDLAEAVEADAVLVEGVAD
jgi:hypothetical protein